jgi:hypothetical protein
MGKSGGSRVGVEVAALEHSLELSSHATRTPRGAVHLRCECAVCGAHTYARPDAIDTERCGNCLSAGLLPIEEVATPAARWGRPRREARVPQASLRRAEIL